MVINAKRWRFTREMIADAPAYRGIYALWENDRLLRLGCARDGETIREKLEAHLEAGGHGATHYSWEISRSPLQRAREIVRMLEGA